MILKRWSVIVVLTLIGLALGAFWLSGLLWNDGVTPQGETDGVFATYAALAGAITTLGTAVFGVLGKLTDYRKANLEVEALRLENEKKRRELETG